MLRALLAGGLAALLTLPLAAHPLRWGAPVVVAEGRGERGPWQQNDSRYDFVDDPAVAPAPGGEVLVAWVDQRRKAVLLQRYASDGRPLFAAPVDVSRQPQTFSWLPRIVADGERVLVLWQEIVFSGGSHGGEMFIARSDDGGRSFGAPRNLSNSVPGDGKGRITRDVWHNGSYDLVAGPDGLVLAAWTEYDGPLWVSRSTDGGASFEAPRRIAGADARRPARAPALARAPDGTLYLAWTHGEDAGADILLARSRDGGRSFDAPRAVAPSPARYSDAPALAVDAQGVLHLAYAESTAGPFAPAGIRYLRSRDGGRRFEPARALAPPLPAGHASAGYPHLALGPGGRVAVAVELFDDPAARPRGLAIAVSLDGGATFTPAALVPGSADPRGGANGSTQGLLMRKLVADGSGRLLLANSALQPGLHSRVWFVPGRFAAE